MAKHSFLILNWSIQTVFLSLSYESNRDQMDQIDVCKIGLAVGTKLSNAGSISLGTAEWEDNSTK